MTQYTTFHFWSVTWHYEDKCSNTDSLRISSIPTDHISKSYNRADLTGEVYTRTLVRKRVLRQRQKGFELASMISSGVYDFPMKGNFESYLFCPIPLH